MEQHPVPRNITGFQFHLIGDMTVRQFGYLAGGALAGFVLYKISPFPLFITITLAGTVALMGFAFAFLPIQERPLDKWLIAFIKSIMAPTQYVWGKHNFPPEVLLQPTIVRITPTPVTHIQEQKDVKAKLHAYLSTLPTPAHEALNKEEKTSIDKTLSFFSTVSLASSPAPIPPSPQPALQPIPAPSIPAASSVVGTPPPPVTPPHVPQVPMKSKPPLQNTPSPAPAISVTPVVKVSAPTSQSSADLSTSGQPTPTPPSPTVTIKETVSLPVKEDEEGKIKAEYQKMIAEKKQLEKELEKLKTELTSTQKAQAVKPVEDWVESKEPHVKTVAAQAVSSVVGMPQTSSVPNLITGVLKDPQKKLLPNIIITIKDKSGMPLRALKTNKLGQFAAATPLSNGTYLLEIEDPMKHFVFDLIEITLSGKAVLPLEIIAKGEKELMREKLSKELFNSNL